MGTVGNPVIVSKQQQDRAAARGQDPGVEAIRVLEATQTLVRAVVRAAVRAAVRARAIQETPETPVRALEAVREAVRAAGPVIPRTGPFRHGICERMAE